MKEHRVRIIKDVSDYKDGDTSPIVFIETEPSVFLEVNEVPEAHHQIHDLLDRIDADNVIPLTWHERAFSFAAFKGKWVEIEPVKEAQNERISTDR